MAISITCVVIYLIFIIDTKNNKFKNSFIQNLPTMRIKNQSQQIQENKPVMGKFRNTQFN